MYYHKLKYKIFVLVFICFLFDNSIYSKNLKFGFSSGYANYDLSGLKTYMGQLKQLYNTSYNIDLKEIEYFKPFVYFDFEIKSSYKNKKFIGWGLRYFNTGARLDYHDYSGSIQSDIQTNCYDLYMIYQYNINFFRNVWFRPFVSYDNLYSFVSENNSGLSNNGNYKTTNSFSSIAQALTLGTDLIYSLGQVEVGFRLSYMFNLNFSLLPGYYKYGSSLDLSSSNYLLDNNHDYIETKWDGIRFGILINFAE